VVTLHTGNFFLGFFCAGLGGAAVSLVIGLPALRIRGLLLAVTTLGFGLAAQDYLFQQSWFFGEGTDTGQPILGHIIFNTGRSYYLLSLVPLAVTLWLAHNVWRGGIGRRLRAVRDNEAAARAFTVRATWVKLQGFLLAGFLAGVGGALYGHSLTRVSAGAFPLQASINVAAMTVLGGLGLLAGPIIGAFYIVGLPQFVPLGNAGLAASSLGWLFLILRYPGGIAQAIQPLRNAVIGLLARLSGVGPDDPVPEAESAMASARPGTLAPRRAAPAAGEGSAPLLKVAAVSKRFGGVQAVDEVSLEVRSGEIVGLIGPNGAGKTTLFELISGFTRPDRGRVIFDGRDVSRDGPEVRGRAGLVRSFQDAALFPTMTVFDTLMVSMERRHPTRTGPSLVGLERRERAQREEVRHLVSAMGLDPFVDKQIGALSTGTRRITELACVVALEPKLLLLDEPASGIAQRETEALGDFILQLTETLQLTVVIIEHDIPMVMRLARRVLAMESGKLIANGTAEEVRNDPRVVESYLGLDPTAIDRSGTLSADAVARSMAGAVGSAR
jgi:ABC-type branched-subunit amino acid transport system ATPase component/ABC-type branched-subunit amino acid transport system permease subunit